MCGCLATEERFLLHQNRFSHLSWCMKLLFSWVLEKYLGTSTNVQARSLKPLLHEKNVVKLEPNGVCSHAYSLNPPHCSSTHLSPLRTGQ